MPLQPFHGAHADVAPRGPHNMDYPPQSNHAHVFPTFDGAHTPLWPLHRSMLTLPPSTH